MDSIQSINDELKSEAASKSRPNSSPKNEEKIQKLNSKVKKHAANISLSSPGGPNALVSKLLNKSHYKPHDIRIEDLNESVLKTKLKELEDAGEVDYYTREIEECKLGTAEYITYLNQQKDKKVSVIQDLIDRTIRQKESFSNKKVAKEQENILKISSLKLQIEQIESKLELKHEEVAHLSDIATRRARHEASVASIRKDMLDAETAHKLRISQVERQLLETRMKCQREADAKVIEMQSAAHDKASKYLEAHTKLLEEENIEMENELRRLIALTEDKLTRKEYLEKTNRELSQELRIRQDIVKVRLEKIVSAHSENDEKNNEIKKYIKAEKRKEMIQTLLKIGIIKESMALALLAGEDKPGTAEDDAAFTVDGINIKSVLNIEID